MKIIAFCIALICGLNSLGQLADGSIAPDFTLEDYDGTTHNLYSYLDEGKTVFVEIFAAHCPSCWNYHQTHRLKNIYEMYGPQGTDEIMVLALEHDQWNNHNAFIGIGDPWVTQGNWLEGTPYPIFDVEGNDRSVFDDYNVTGYPYIYKICPDRILERVMTFETESQLYDKVEACLAALSIENETTDAAAYIDQSARSLVLIGYDQINLIRVTDITGRIVKTINNISSDRATLTDLKSGIYLFEIQSDKGREVKKLYLK